MTEKISSLIMICCVILGSILLSGCAMSDKALFQLQTTALRNMVSDLTVEDNPAMEGLSRSNSSPGQLVAMASDLITCSIPDLAKIQDDNQNWFLEESLLNIKECPHCAAKGNIVSSEYGNRRVPNQRTVRFHAGIDISVPQGSGIMAFKGGIVTRATRHSTYGLVVEIQQYDGYLARYAHMNRMLVERGDVVHGGQLIGEVGRTGRTTGPHLHFELIKDGDSQDPMLFLTKIEQVVHCKYLETTSL